MLIRMVEAWIENLDNNFVAGAVLTHLSKAFDCISHDLIVIRFATFILI